MDRRVGGEVAGMSDKDQIKKLLEENGRLKHLLAKQMRTGEGLEVEGIILSDLTPSVVMRWGDMKGDLTPEMARRHGVTLIQAAIWAEVDTHTIKFLLSTGMPEDLAYQTLGFMRQDRAGQSHASFDSMHEGGVT